MKTIALIVALLFVSPKSAYDFKLKTIDGKGFKLSKYKGKKILIVNTASKCGFTPQYAELQKLADQYKDKLVVIGFPANNFHEQEPGANVDIKAFCQKNYGVTFPLSEKVSVKGNDIDPLFQYLTTAENPDFTGEIKWNFEKFLLDENGKLIHRYRSKTTPLSAEITSQL
jgi:glutathione peroxidase